MHTMSDVNYASNIAAGNTITSNSCSGVAWPAILGGALTATVVSLALLILGSALGLSMLSPWSHQTVASFSVKAVIWLIIMQWVASGLGGYLTGRLRVKWSGVHTEEVFFRDTANGFLAWVVATLLTASIFAFTASSVVSGGVKAGAVVAGGAAAGAANQTTQASENGFRDSNGYYIDGLFRSNVNPVTTSASVNQSPAASTGSAQVTPVPSTSSANSTAPAGNANASLQDVRAETVRILAMGMKNGTVPDTDKAYLAQLISEHTNVSNAEASKRVDDIINQLNADKEKARQQAEEARKVTMHVSLYIFLSLLIGAFIACIAGALGGKQRDEY